MPKLPMREAFGAETVDRLAALAIDMALAPSVKQNKYAHAARVPWRLVHKTRDVLTDAGLDWAVIIESRRS